MSASIAALVAQLAELTEVLRPVAARLAADVETSPAGRDPEPAPEGPAVATTGQPGDRRAATIAGLRELADLLETRPEMPMPQYGLSVSGSLAHGGVDDDAASIERVRQAAAVLGAEVDDRIVHQGKRHHAIEAEFGGVRLRLSYIETGAAAAAPTDIAQAEGMVAGPEGASGPATAPEVTHEQAAGWGGAPGKCGVECSCGVTYDGFDTIAEAEALRAGHADRDDATAPEPDPCPKGDPDCGTGDDGSCHDACEPATAPEWTPGAGWERLQREMPGIVPELTDDDLSKADEVIAAAARPIVLVESPIPGGPPARAEVSEDKGGTTVKVVYCDSRTGARVARRRILGLDVGGAYTAEFLHGPAVTDVLDAPHPDESEG